MIKSSIIRAKLLRSRISFDYTFFEKGDINRGNFDDIKLIENEEIIAFYEENDYRWILTNINFFIPKNELKIKLSDLTKVDFEKVKKNIETKSINTELTLYTEKRKYKVFFEEGTWHVFYNLFLFIIK